MATSPYVKQLIELTGKNEREVQSAWKKAQELTADNFGMSIEEFSRKQYQHAMETAKRLLGLREQSYVKEFYESEKSASEFLDEAVMTSGDVGADLDHATMRGQKGTAPEATADNEDEERTSKEYDSVEAFDEPQSSPEGSEMGEPVESGAPPEHNEDEVF